MSQEAWLTKNPIGQFLSTPPLQTDVSELPTTHNVCCRTATVSQFVHENDSLSPIEIVCRHSLLYQYQSSQSPARASMIAASKYFNMDSIYICLSIFNQSIYSCPVPHAAINCCSGKQDFHQSWSRHQICSLLLLPNPVWA